MLSTTTIATAVFISLLMLLHYYQCYKTVATDKLLRASLFPGAAELTTPLLRLTNILGSPCVESINWVSLPSKTVAISYTCGSSVSLRHISYCRAQVVVAGLEDATCELRSQTGDDVFRHTESAYNPLDELYGGLGGYGTHCLHLH
jgi:hypothetical protein